MTPKFGPRSALIEWIAAAMLVAAGGAMLGVLMRPIATERHLIIEALLGLMLIIGGGTYWGHLAARRRSWTEGYLVGWKDQARVPGLARAVRRGLTEVIESKVIQEDDGYPD